MAPLRYFGFVLATASYIDSCIHYAFQEVYSFGKKHASSALEVALEYSQAWFLVMYTPLHKWLCRIGVLILEKADFYVGKGVAKIETQILSESGERLTKVREFWRAIGAHISEHWDRHGVLIGTLVMLAAFIQVLIFLFVKLLTSGPFHGVCQSIQDSKTVGKGKVYFHEKINPCLKKAGYESMVRLRGSLDLFKDKIDPVVTTMVDNEYYKKAYHYINDAKGKIEATKIYTDVVLFMDPYVGPTLKKVWTSEMCINLMEKLTPAKED